MTFSASPAVTDEPEDNSSGVETDEPTETDEPAPSDTQVASRTMMVYMIGSTLEYDNGLVGLASGDIEEMQAATYSDDVNIIIQTGGAEEWKNPAIKGGHVQRFKLEKDGLNELDDLGQVCMTKESTLSEFIKFASHNYPAEEYVLVLWDHGGGVPNGFGKDVFYPSEILSDVEIGKALKMGGVHFGLVAFDACLMCSLEVYMSIKDYADYAVAAESSVTGYGLNYEIFLNELNDTDRSVADCGNALGITAYFPYELTPLYNNGRTSLVELDYDTSVVDFYDILASNQLYYNDLTQYAGSWYVQPEGAQQSGKVIKLDIVQSGGYNVVQLTEEDWDIIYPPSCGLICEDEDGMLNFGFDYVYSLDGNGNLKIVMPDTWLQFDGIVPTSNYSNMWVSYSFNDVYGNSYYTDYISVIS